MTELMAWQMAVLVIGVGLWLMMAWVSNLLSTGLGLRKALLTIHERLARISALETPKGSATSKKMARIARGEE